MEHILQFGVTIDEQKIIDHATDSASKAIINKVKSEIDDYTRGWSNNKLHQLFAEEVKKVVNDNKDKIIEETIKNCSVNMMKTKAVKGAIANMINEVE